MTLCRLLSVPALLLAMSLPALGQSVVTFDENGNGNIDGTPMPSAVQADPGPGGGTTLVYQLSFPGTQGDVLVGNPYVPGDDDLLRFNGDSTLAVYSAVGYPPATLADNAFPTSLYPNQIPLTKSGDGLEYFPGPGQPGFDISLPIFEFIDPVTPEPGPLAMLGGLAVSALGIAARRRRVALGRRTFAHPQPRGRANSRLGSA
jgi:hypothetical protein